MRTSLPAALALLLVLAPAAFAHLSRKSRVHNIRHVAAAAWGDVCDVGTMAVSIRRVSQLPNDEWIAAAHRRGSFPYHGCRVAVLDIRWPTRRLCHALIHELGHLAGWRARRGEERVYRNEHGRVVHDFAHHRSPRSVMHTPLTGEFAECRHIRQIAAQFPSP